MVFAGVMAVGRAFLESLSQRVVLPVCVYSLAEVWEGRAPYITEPGVTSGCFLRPTSLCTGFGFVSMVVVVLSVIMSQ